MPSQRQSGRPAVGPHGGREAPLPAIGDGEVVVCLGVVRIGAERLLEASDRPVEIARLEPEVPEIGECRREARLAGERRGKGLRGPGRVPGRDPRKTLLIVGEGPLPMLHVDLITLFPEMFAPVVGLSIVGRAVERGLVEVTVHDVLAAVAPGERADERPYGGGPGMVLRLEPLVRTLDAIAAAAPPDERRAVVLTAAAGRPFGQADAERWRELDRLILICGHYEGVDERLGAIVPLEEVSLGPFVLTGGEIAAMAFLDATVRLVEGAIDPASRAAESFAGGGEVLDHPAFTRPPVFRGVAVPEVLLSGDHARIAEWRRQRARERAAARATRPTLNE